MAEKKKKINWFSESVFLVYFTELSKKYKPSSLWSTYSMLRNTINIQQGINIENYTKLRALLKRQSEGFQPKKTNTFSGENIKDFLNQAPDEKYLATKVETSQCIFLFLVKPYYIIIKYQILCETSLFTFRLP